MHTLVYTCRLTHRGWGRLRGTIKLAHSQPHSLEQPSWAQLWAAHPLLKMSVWTLDQVVNVSDSLPAALLYRNAFPFLSPIYGPSPHWSKFCEFHCFFLYLLIFSHSPHIPFSSHKELFLIPWSYHEITILSFCLCWILSLEHSSLPYIASPN